MSKLPWLLVFVLGYWAYCIFWGWKGARTSRTPSDYFIAGRGIGMWVFVLAATATSFSGWTFVGHPGTIYKTGLRFLLRDHHTTHRRAVPEAPVAVGQTVRLHHPG